MIKQNLSLFLLAASLTTTTNAQFDDTTFYHVSYAATGIMNKTNEVSSYVLTNVFKFNVSKKDVRVNVNSNWLFGQQQNRLTNNDFSSSLDFNLYKTLPHFYNWGLANYDKSYSLKIINRYQVGVGAAYNILDKPAFSLNLSDGALYESSNLKLNDSTINQYKVFRNSLRLRYRIVLRDVLELSGTNLLQNAIRKDGDYIISL